MSYKYSHGKSVALTAVWEEEHLGTLLAEDGPGAWKALKHHPDNYRNKLPIKW